MGHISGNRVYRVKVIPVKRMKRNRFRKKKKALNSFIVDVVFP